jgi:hypothetical protein
MTKSGYLLSILIVFAIATTLYVQYPAIIDPYRIDDDLRQYFWMVRFTDPTLFPDDYLLSNVKGVHEVGFPGLNLLVQYESWGFSLLYWLAGALMHPITFNKLLPFGLMLVSVVYLYLLGKSLRDEGTGFLLGLLFVVFSLSASANISVMPGLERSFSFPLLIVFLYYFVQQAPIGSALTLAVQTTIYFPTFVVSAATYALSLVRFKERRPTLDLSRRRLLPLVIGVGLSLVFFAPALLSVAGAEAPYSTDMPLRENPYYSANGRIPIFGQDLPLGLPLYVLTGYGGLATYQDIANMVPLLLILLCMFATMGRDGLRVPTTMRLFFLGTLGAWLLSWVAALVFNDFILRYPFKYSSAALPLFLLVVVAYNLESFARVVAHLWQRSKSRRGLLLMAVGSTIIIIASLAFLSTDPRFINRTAESVRIVGVVLGAVPFVLGINQLARLRLKATKRTAPEEPASRRGSQAALVIIMLIPMIAYGLRIGRNTTMIKSNQRSLYDFVSTLPKDALLAGDLMQMDNIPLFAQRSVLFSFEITGVDESRILTFFDAYYAESPDTILGFCQDYGVEYLVVNLQQFSPDYLEKGMFFFAPQNETIARSVAARSNFILPQVPDDHKLFQSGDLFVIPCSADVFH